jgi:hypothetical protein
MAENYDTLKENNLRQMVSEYENERKKLLDARATDEQRRRDWMKEVALDEIEEIHERELGSDGKPYWLFSHYDPNAFMWAYARHCSDNALANMVRNYAAVYDAKNLDKYPVSTPLPRMKDLWDPYIPGDFTYKTLKRLAAYCSKWRQK